MNDVRNRMAELLEAVESGEFGYVTRRGSRAAALVPVDVAREAEYREDEYWSRRAREAEERIASGEEEVISFDRLVAETEGRA